MAEQTVKVRDKTGKEQRWIIEEELDKAYKIFSNGIITYIYKASCYEIEGQLYSFECRNNDWVDIPDCWDCGVCHFQCFQEVSEECKEEIESTVIEEDRSVDWGYLEPDWYGLDIICDEEGNMYGV